MTTTNDAYAAHLPDEMSLYDAARDPAIRGYLSTRALRLVERGVFPTVGDLRRASDQEFAQIPGCGIKTRNEIRWAFGANPRPDEPSPHRPPPPTPPSEFVIADGDVYASMRINIDRNREIIRLHEAGVSKRAIAELFGISAPRAHQIIKHQPVLEAKLKAAVRVTKMGMP